MVNILNWKSKTNLSVIKFLIRWSAANLMGLLIAFILFLPFYFFSGDNPTHKGIAGGALGGGLGVGQWIVLRHQLSRPGWWILVSIVGGIIGGAVFGYGTIEEFSNRGVTRDYVGIVLGGSIGLFQVLVLRTKFNFAYWWICICSIGFGSGWWLAWRIDFGLEYTSLLSLLVGIIVIFIPFLIISGFGIIWILRHPKPRPISN